MYEIKEIFLIYPKIKRILLLKNNNVGNVWNVENVSNVRNVENVGNVSNVKNVENLKIPSQLVLPPHHPSRHQFLETKKRMT